LSNGGVEKISKSIEPTNIYAEKPVSKSVFVKSLPEENEIESSQKSKNKLLS
jgi:hypothetical protein